MSTLPTFTEEYRTLDRSLWAAGPWDTEPDKAVWVDEATGLAAMIRRGGGGALCGYVGVPEGHPWHGKDYAACTHDPGCSETWCSHSPGHLLDVHGGITFAAGCDEDGDREDSICHLADDGRPVWWFGFDCAHHNDRMPGYGFDTSTRHGTYRALPYVVAETTSLAAQLAAVAEAAAA